MSIKYDGVLRDYQFAMKRFAEDLLAGVTYKSDGEAYLALVKSLTKQGLEVSTKYGVALEFHWLFDEEGDLQAKREFTAETGLVLPVV